MLSGRDIKRIGRVVRLVEGMRGSAPDSEPLRMTFPFGSDHLWGIVEQYGATVTIAAGEFAAGAGSPLTTAQTTFTITKDPTWIGIQYAPSLGTLTLLGPGVAGYTETDRPTLGNGLFRAPLYLFSYDGTSAAYVREYLYYASAALFAYEPGP